MNQQPVEPLTKREMDVADLIAEGYTDAQIAHKLGLTWATVRFYVDNIMMKLGAPNRVVICRWWHRNEWPKRQLQEKKA